MVVVSTTSQQKLVVSLLDGVGGINFIFMIKNKKTGHRKKRKNSHECGNPDVAFPTADTLPLLSKSKLSFSTFLEHTQFLNPGFDA